MHSNETTGHLTVSFFRLKRRFRLRVLQNKLTYAVVFLLSMHW